MKVHVKRGVPSRAMLASRAGIIGIVTGLVGGCGGGGGHDLSVSFSYAVATEVQVLGAADVRPEISGLEGNAPRCSLQSGSLPPGIALQSDCTISGAATRSGPYAAVVKLTAANYSGSVTTELDLNVPDLALAPIAAAPGQAITVGTPQSGLKVFGITGYTPTAGDSLHYTLVSGTLPAGLSVDPASGTLSGTATTLGTSPVAVSMTLTRGGSSAVTAVTPLDLIVSEPPLTVSYPNCCTISVGVPFSVDPTSSFVGATNASIGYALGSGATLPPGLALDPLTGVISGTPSDFVPSVTPSTITVVATAVLPTGTATATTLYFQFDERGIYPFYPVSSLGQATGYGSTPDYPYALSVVATPGRTETWAAGTIYGGKAGDVYHFSIVASPFGYVAPPSWVSVDPSSGAVTIALPAAGASARGVGFGVRIAVTRNGVTYTQTQGWSFNN